MTREPPAELWPVVAELRVGHRQLFWTQLGPAEDPTDVLFGGLSLSAYKAWDAIKGWDEALAEELLLRAAVCWPPEIEPFLEQLDAWPYGEAQRLAEQVLANSGWTDQHAFPYLLNHAQLDLHGGTMPDGTVRPALADRKLVALVCKAFPGMRPAEVEQLPLAEFCEHVAMAEFITGTPLEIETEESRQKKKLKGARKEKDRIIEQAMRDKKQLDFGKENAGLKSMLAGE